MVRGRKHDETEEKRGKGDEERQAAGSGQRQLPAKPPFFADWEGHGAFAGVKEEEPEQADAEELAPQPLKVERDLETDSGVIHIENYCPPERLTELEIDSGIVMFTRSKPERQKQALVRVAEMPEGNVVAATLKDTLVAYIGIHLPSESERWGKPGYKWLFELGAIEVSRNYRRLHLADEMLSVAFADPFYEDKIVLTTGFTWHWDFEGTGMDRQKYHQVGIELMGRHGFMEMMTDEPNVAMDPANLFLVRLGRDSSFSRYQRFASLLFSNEWEAMLRGF